MEKLETVYEDFFIPPLAGAEIRFADDNRVVRDRKSRGSIPLAGQTIVSLSSPARKLSDKQPKVKNNAKEKFNDESFNIKKGERLSSMKVEMHKKRFEVNGLQAHDVIQGSLGDCWFLSALSTLVDEGEGGPRYKIQNKIKTDIAEKVLQADKNSTEEAHALGKYHFSFYNVSGWQEVKIDDRLPDRLIASQSKDSEWWVPLAEKAYAKFHSGYENLDGGNTNWSLTELSGGISCELKNLASSLEKVRNIDLESVLLAIKEYSMICCSNLDDINNLDEIKGLVSLHAYAVLRVERMALRSGEELTMVKLRNPWGSTEWTGKWADKDKESWRKVRKREKKRIGFENKDDGSFWMTFDDWLKEFEIFNFCALPELESNRNGDNCSSVTGFFSPGRSSPVSASQLSKLFLESRYNAQAYFEVTETENKEEMKPTRFVWLQLLLDSKITERTQIIVDLYRISEKPENYIKLEKQRLKKENSRGNKVLPLIPFSRGYEIENYKHNGYLFDLQPGKYIISFAASKEKSAGTFAWKLRAFGNDLKLKKLQ